MLTPGCLPWTGSKSRRTPTASLASAAPASRPDDLALWSFGLWRRASGGGRSPARVEKHGDSSLRCAAFKMTLAIAAEQKAQFVPARSIKS